MSCDNMKPYACGGSMNPNTVQNPCDRNLHFEGADDVTINQGVGIDLTEGVHAYDANGNEIEYTVEPDSIEKCEVGDHVITYTATGEGSRSVPTMCGETALYARACNVITEIKERIITILQSANPIIRGLSDALIQPNETFAPLSGVTAEDANGNELTVSYSGRYTNTEEGDIATFDTPYAEPFVSLIADIDTIQDTSGGAPSPSNICPISGWDSVDVSVAGKNLLNPLTGYTGIGYNKASGTDATLTEDSTGMTIDGNELSIVISASWGGRVIKTAPLKAGDYRVNIETTNSNQKTSVYTIGTDGNTRGSAYNLSGIGTVAMNKTLYDGESIAIWLGSSVAQTIKVLNPQIELGNTATSYEPYTGQTYHTTLPQTVYGGTLDVVSGVLTVDRYLVVLNGTEVAYGTGIAPNGNRYFTVSGMDSLNSTNPENYYSNMFEMVQPTGNAIVVGVSYVTGAGRALLFVLPQDITTSEEAHEYFANQNAQFVLPLATPQTIRLTPTQIDSLLGRNNVWADSGDVTVWYVDEIPQSAFSYPVRGIYTITYTAEDECGNRTEKDRTIQVGEETYRTVLYTDGTLIINESSFDQTTNRQLHGVATHVYEPMNEDGTNYVFQSNPETLWHDFLARPRIKSVKIGSPIRPISTAYWFYRLGNCESMDLTNLDTSRVTDMTYMFGYVGYDVSSGDAVPYLDLTMFDTSNVQIMDYMFNHLHGAKEIDISSFDTSSVTSMARMFSYCNLTETIYASQSFVPLTGDIAQTFSFFADCNNLVGGNGTAYASTSADVRADSTYARIDNPPDEPGYFTQG